MKVRVLTAIGIGVVGIPILIFSDTVVYPIALGLLSLLAVWELLRVFGLHKKYTVSVPSYLISALLPFISSDLFVGAERHRDHLLFLAIVMFGFLLYLAAVSVLSGGKMSFANLSGVFTSVCYVTVSFTAMSLLRYMECGGFFVGILFTACWSCDTFAYFTGRLFGKHKLSPELSPKKTVEGALGGILFSVLGCLLFGLIVELLFEERSADYPVLAVIGLVCSLVSQIGDLFASLIKREHGVKDYSRMLPGHGGVMDRFDSILASAGVLMVICMIASPIK